MIQTRAVFCGDDDLDTEINRAIREISDENCYVIDVKFDFQASMALIIYETKCADRA